MSTKLSPSIDALRAGNCYDESCQRTVPQALICALDANDFEDAIRNAISLGGDSDTLEAMAGSVAEARFGMPEAIARETWARLPDDMRRVISRLYAVRSLGAA